MTRVWLALAVLGLAACARADVAGAVRAKAEEEAKKRAMKLAEDKIREAIDKRKHRDANGGGKAAGDANGDSDVTRQVPKDRVTSDDPVRDAADAVMGEYAGTWQPAEGDIVGGTAEVMGYGEEKHRLYRAVLKAFEPGKEVKTLVEVTLSGTPKDGRVELAQEGWTGEIAGDRLTAGSKAGKFQLRFRVRKSPTEGVVPPAGATVLLAFQPGKKPSLEEWTNAKWEPLEDGSVRVGGGSSSTKKEFGDCRLHVEFCCPYERENIGQARAGGGVSVHGKYAVRVLDSFGVKSDKNDCGAVFGVAAPLANASLPPGRWQTYDIVFRAPRMGADGAVAEPATFVSVHHNGVLVQENVKVEQAARSGEGSGQGSKGPLVLQDHKSPVRYRNIWVVETN
jgi:hypothetical protein